MLPLSEQLITAAAVCVPIIVLACCVIVIMLFAAKLFPDKELEIEELKQKILDLENEKRK